MQHSLSGSLEIDGTEICFDKGKGYIEKDWGRSMPSDWIWIQSNHFDTDPCASFMLLRSRTHKLKVTVYRDIGGVLKAPRHGNMERDIQESIVSSLQLVLMDHSGKLLFTGTGTHAGLEIVGDVAKYFRNNH